MDGSGRWTDNDFIEQLWRSLEFEEVYLRAYVDGLEARADIGDWMTFCDNPSLSSGAGL
jgi:putative transposase